MWWWHLDLQWVHISQWLMYTTNPNEHLQEWFTSRNLELCAWQRSFSMGTGTSFDLITLRRSTKTYSGFSDSRLCHNIDTCKASTPVKTGFGYSHIWLDMIWICLYHSICALFVEILKKVYNNWFGVQLFLADHNVDTSFLMLYVHYLKRYLKKVHKCWFRVQGGTYQCI